MPTTDHGITYPASTGHTRLGEPSARMTELRPVPRATTDISGVLDYRAA